MKHIVIVLACLSMSLVLKAQNKNYQVAAISFYNFENCFDTINDPKKMDEDFLPNGPYHYTKEVYYRKLHNLATVISQLGTELTPDGPAILGTAEIENDRVLEDLEKQPEIVARNYKHVWFDGPDIRSIDCGLLYNPKYFKVIYAESLTVDIAKSGEKGGKTRDILHVCGNLLGDTVHVFVNHWPSRRGGEAASAPLRAIAAGVCKRVIDSLMAINPATKAIIMGDLNDDPTSPSVKNVLGAKEEKSATAYNEIYNPWIKFYNKGLGTLAYQDAWGLFDQVMLTGNFLKNDDAHWRYYKAEVFNRNFLIAKTGQYKGYPHRSFDGNNWIDGYSDHFPVVLYLIKASN